MVKERISNKASSKHFCSSEAEIDTLVNDTVLPPGTPKKQSYYSTQACWLKNDYNQLGATYSTLLVKSITSYPASPRRIIIIVKYHFRILTFHPVSQNSISNCLQLLRPKSKESQGLSFSLWPHDTIKIKHSFHPIPQSVGTVNEAILVDSITTRGSSISHKRSQWNANNCTISTITKSCFSDCL